MLLVSLIAFAVFLAIGSLAETHTNPLQVSVNFPTGNRAGIEPLIIIASGRRILESLSVEYIGGNHFLFRHQAGNAPALASPVFDRDPHSHLVQFHSPGLVRPRPVGRIARQAASQFEVMLDGVSVLTGPHAGFSEPVSDVYLGTHGWPGQADFSGSLRARPAGLLRGAQAMVRVHPYRTLAMLLVAIGAGLAIMTWWIGFSRVVTAVGPLAAIFLASLFPLLLLANLSHSFAEDWFAHTWLGAYSGVFFTYHFSMPFVVHTARAIGLLQPVFYGQLPYAVLGILSTLAGPDLAVRIVIFTLRAWQFREIFQTLKVLRWNTSGALIIAAITTWSIYPLTNLYNRSALTEFFATSLLVMLGARLARYAENPPGRSRYADILWISALCSMMILTHPITAIFGMAVVAVLVLLVLSTVRVAGREYVAIGGGILLVMASTCSWFYAVLTYHSHLFAAAANRSVYLFDFDTLWVRLFPVPLDPRTIQEGTRVSTPYLEAQINIPLLIVAAYVAAYGISRLARLHETANPASELQSRRFGLGAAVLGSVIALVSLLASAVPAVAHRIPPSLGSIQFGYRLVTYIDLGMLLIVMGLGAAGAFSGDARAYLVLTAALMLSAAGVVSKEMHGSAASSNESRWASEADVSAMPAEFHAIADYTTPIGSNVTGVGQRLELPVGSGPAFGSVGTRMVEVPPATIVTTNVLSFPWNVLYIDGRPAEAWRLHTDGVFVAVQLDGGRHQIGYQCSPPEIWLWLRRLSWVALTVNVVFAFAFSSHWLRRPMPAKT